MDKVIGFLESLATKLGTTVEALWPNAVRHVALEGLSSVVSAGVLLVIILTILFVYRKQPWFANYAAEGQQRVDNGPSARLLLTVAAGILTMVTVSSSCINMAKILEPEGYLVRQILRR